MIKPTPNEIGFEKLVWVEILVRFSTRCRVVVGFLLPLLSTVVVTTRTNN